MNQNSSTTNDLPVNVEAPERLLSVLSGYLLLTNAVRKRSWLQLLAGGYLMFRGSTGHCVAYEAMDKPHLPDFVQNVNMTTSMIVNKPRSEVYAFWRKLENLPRFMKHLESVTEYEGGRSVWKAKIPGGMGTVGWDAEIVKEEEGQLLGWNSLPGSSVHNAGKVEFRDAADNGTEISVVISYRAPLGAIGEGVIRLLSPVFERLIEQDIKGFKEYIEKGDNKQMIMAANDIPVNQ